MLAKYQLIICLQRHDCIKLNNTSSQALPVRARQESKHRHPVSALAVVMERVAVAIYACLSSLGPHGFTG